MSLLHLGPHGTSNNGGVNQRFTACFTPNVTLSAQARIKRAMKLGLAFSLVGLVACGGGGGSSGDSGSSSTSASSSSTSSNSTSSSSSSSTSGGMSNTSHNAGEDCLSCHRDGGSAPVTFTAAGTMYASGSTPQTNGTVRLYVHDTNDLIITLTTDDSGNFYATEDIPALRHDDSVGGIVGVDPVIEGPSGMTRSMPGLITNGSCNGCHGNGNGVLTVN